MKKIKAFLSLVLIVMLSFAARASEDSTKLPPKQVTLYLNACTFWNISTETCDRRQCIMVIYNVVNGVFVTGGNWYVLGNGPCAGPATNYPYRTGAGADGEMTDSQITEIVKEEILRNEPGAILDPNASFTKGTQ